MHPFSLHLGTLVRWCACCQMEPLLTDFCYRAGGPGSNPEDVKWLDDKLKAFLEDESW